MLHIKCVLCSNKEIPWKLVQVNSVYSYYTIIILIDSGRKLYIPNYIKIEISKKTCLKFVFCFFVFMIRDVLIIQICLKLKCILEIPKSFFYYFLFMLPTRNLHLFCFNFVTDFKFLIETS